MIINSADLADRLREADAAAAPFLERYAAMRKRALKDLRAALSDAWNVQRAEDGELV